MEWSLGHSSTKEKSQESRDQSKPSTHIKLCQMRSVSRAYSDVLLALGERALLQLADGLEWPSSALQRQPQRQRHVDDDLLLRRLLLALDDHDVLAANVANPARDVKEPNRGNLQASGRRFQWCGTAYTGPAV